MSPVLFLLFFPALRWAWAQRRERVVVFFFLFGGLALLVMSLMAFRQRVNPNWPAAFLFGSLGLILCWGFSSAWRKIWLKRGIAVAAAFNLSLLLLLPLLEPLAQPLAKLGLQPQRRGWQGYPQLVAQIEALSTADEPVIFVGHRFTASQFAFHGPDPKRVHLWNGNPVVIQNQLDFFDPPQVGGPVVIVVERKKAHSTGKIPADLQQRLDVTRPLSELPMHPVRDYPRFQVYHAERLLSWPGPDLTGSKL